MKIPLAAVTLAIAGLGASPVNPPAEQLEPAPKAGAALHRVPVLELNPHAIDPEAVPLGALRQASVSAFAERLQRLDNRATELNTRADLAALRADFEQQFERLKVLRSKVETALLDLRDPEIGLDAAEYAVATALDELQLAIEALGKTFEQQGPPRVS